MFFNDFSIGIFLQCELLIIAKKLSDFFFIFDQKVELFNENRLEKNEKKVGTNYRLAGKKKRGFKMNSKDGMFFVVVDELPLAEALLMVVTAACLWLCMTSLLLQLCFLLYNVFTVPQEQILRDYGIIICGIAQSEHTQC